ncbi:MAG: hypothetical protein HQM09_23470 [Candidatus Riflebacteria bacterium]|nr:hypothetical protein [Candidatus Riflebacteria bacterium]
MAVQGGEAALYYTNPAAMAAQAGSQAGEGNYLSAAGYSALALLNVFGPGLLGEAAGGRAAVAVAIERQEANIIRVSDLRFDLQMFGGQSGKVFTSTDPLLSNLASKIEAMYPNHVVGVNVPLRDAAGNLLTDADILLQNAVIQVKSGGSAQGLLRQLNNSEAVTGLPSIGFAPNLPGNSLRSLSQQGGLVTADESLLLQLIKP